MGTIVPCPLGTIAIPKWVFFFLHFPTVFLTLFLRAALRYKLQQGILLFTQTVLLIPKVNVQNTPTYVNSR